jgi:hypothetical protein
LANVSLRPKKSYHFDTTFFIFSRKIQIVRFISLSFNLWGIAQLLFGRMKNEFVIGMYRVIEF